MAAVTIFSASHCHGDDVATAVAERFGSRFLTTEELVAEAAERYGVPDKHLLRAMGGPPSLLERFTQDRPRNVVYLKCTLADQLDRDELVYHGFASHLVSDDLTHVLRVALVARREYRLAEAGRRGLGPAQADKALEADDESQRQWALQVRDTSPWDKKLYDLFIPVDEVPIAQAVDEICQFSQKAPLLFTPDARRASRDHQLACRVELALIRRGHQMDVSCEDGVVTVVINKYVMRVEALRRELDEIASGVDGVEGVITRVGAQFRRPALYANLDLPQKLLLVDDEEEFVHTLSERLQARNHLEPMIAHDGESALSMVENDAPDVMVLDLKMPGIDGLEVLKRVKREHPRTEVIILTGHGSQADQEAAERLGAFAFLNKPVDIDVLAQTMKDAYAKLARERDGQVEGTPSGYDEDRT